MLPYYENDDEFLTQVQYLTDNRVIKLRGDLRLNIVGRVIVESHRSAFLWSACSHSFSLAGIGEGTYPTIHLPEKSHDC